MNKKHLTDLNRRLLVSFVAIGIVSFLLAFYTHFLITILLVLVVAVLAGVGVWEYAQFAKEKDLFPISRLMITVAVLEVFAFFAAHKHFVFAGMPALILVVGAVLFFLAHFRGTSNAILHIAVEFFGVCYVAVPLSFLLGILYPLSDQGIGPDGRWWLVYLIFVTKITDVGGYFVGRLWGKRPLAPVLSPKKTVEGAIAGFISAVIASCAMSYLGEVLDPMSFRLPLGESLLLGMVIGVFAQIGDLAESLLKRDAVVKDSNTLPGIGGVLDMVDSLLLTTPIVYFYLQMSI